MTQRNSITVLLGAVAAGLALGACGSPVQPPSAHSSPVVSGVASRGAAATTVTLKDSSTPAQVATATANADGAYSIDVSGLTGPFLLKAQWKGATGTDRMYSMATAAGTANINELSDALMVGASGSLSADDVYSTYSGKDSHTTATSFMDLLRQLQTVLAPLFDLYGIANPISDDATRKTAGITAMLKDVRITTSNGTVTVTNRATGGIIFQGPLNDLASGTFYPENMPAGPGPLDGAALYTANCAGCHGPLATSTVKGATAAQIQSALTALTNIGAGNVGVVGGQHVDFVTKSGEVTVNRWLTTAFLAASASSNESGYITNKVIRALGMTGIDNQARV